MGPTSEPGVTPFLCNCRRPTSRRFWPQVSKTVEVLKGEHRELRALREERTALLSRCKSAVRIRAALRKPMFAARGYPSAVHC